MRRSTKGQIQFAEIVIILIIFFFIIGVGLIFFTHFLEGESKKESGRVEQLNLAETAKVFSSLPEIHCSSGGDIDYTCIDVERLDAFRRQVEQHPLRYSNLFTGYRINVTCVYPCTEQSVVIFPGDPGAQDTSAPFILPVVLSDPVTNKYEYGEVLITQES